MIHLSIAFSKNSFSILRHLCKHVFLLSTHRHTLITRPQEGDANAQHVTMSQELLMLVSLYHLKRGPIN